jgi:IS30 family transposase
MTAPYRQFTQGQHYPIEGGLAAGKSQARSAKKLGVHPAMISREVRRNTCQTIYKGASATKLSDARRAGARQYCTPATWLSHHHPRWLKHGMNPKQIAQ